MIIVACTFDISAAVFLSKWRRRSSIAVFDDRGPAGQDVRVALQYVVGVLALQAIEQRQVAIHVIEILEQPEPIGLCQVFVRLVLRNGGGDFDRDLFVRDGGFERRVVGAEQPVDRRRLVLLHAPHLGQRNLQRAVHTCIRMAETTGFQLDAIHENHPHPGECVVVQFADGRHHHVAPRKALAVQRAAPVAQKIDGHSASPVRVRADCKCRAASRGRQHAICFDSVHEDRVYPARVRAHAGIACEGCRPAVYAVVLSNAFVFDVSRFSCHWLLQ
jgi:hypothetical protein